MSNLYKYAKQNPISSVFPYSMIFPNYESLGQIRFEICLLIFSLITCSFVVTLVSFISLRNSLLIILYLLPLLTGTLVCLYLFHNLILNFANALWLYVVPVVFIDTSIHLCYNQTGSKWKYNRIIVSLMVSLLVLFSFPIQTYIYRIVRNSLIYQSLICAILINFILPSWFYLLQSNDTDNQMNNVESSTTDIIGNPSLPNGREINNTVNELNGNTNDSL